MEAPDPASKNPGPRREGILIFAGNPRSADKSARFSARLLEALTALARAAFSRGRPVIIFNDERLLPVLLSISTEYTPVDEAGVRPAPWITVYGHLPEPLFLSLRDWREAGILGHRFQSGSAEVYQGISDRENIGARFVLGGDVRSLFVMRQNLRFFDGPQSRHPASWINRPSFFINSVNETAEPFTELTPREMSDLSFYDKLRPALGQIGIALESTPTAENISLLYPLIVQMMLDSLGGGPSGTKPRPQPLSTL